MRQADRIIVNVISNYGLMLLGIVANLLMVPVVTGHLGRSGFGLATMILSVSGIFDLLANSLGRTLERYIPPSLGEKEHRQSRRLISTALAGFVLVGLIGSVIVYLLRHWLTSDVPSGPGFERDAQWACLLLAAYVLVGFPWVCYQKALGAMQRYDLLSLYVGSTTLLRMIVVIIAFWIGRGSISIYVGSLLLSLLAAGVLCRQAVRRLIPEYSESVRDIDRATIQTVSYFSAGALLIVVGNILVNQGYAMFVGKTLGIYKLGGLAAVLTVRTLLWTLISNVAGVLTPAVSSLQARGADDHIAKLFLSGSKYSSMMSVMICGVPLLLAEPFLELWLGAEFKGLGLLLYMLLIAQIPLSPGLTSQQVLTGLGRVQLTGIIVLTRGALALLAALIYVKCVGPSLEGSAACVFGMQLVGGVVLFLFAASMTRIPWPRALMEVLGLPILMGAAGAVVSWWVASWLGSTRWWTLITATAAGEVVFLVLALLFGFNHEEKTRLYSFAGRVRNRLMPPLETTIHAAEGET